MSVLGNAKSNRHRKTYPVEPGGTGRKYMFLLGETWRVRASQESAEAIVCAGQRPDQVGSNPTGARMWSAISKSGGNASLAGEYE